MIPTNADVQKYFTDPNKRHIGYKETVKLANELKVHADGKFPLALIQERRPYESVDNQKYREAIAIGINEDFFSIILSSLMKIRKSPDWSIKYSSEDVPKVLTARPEETLQYYCEEAFPYFTSVTNWIFDVYLRQSLVDTNSVCMITPLDFDIADNEFLKPFPIIFDSEQVYDFQYNKLAVLRSSDKCEYTVGQTTFYDGDIFFIVTDEVIQIYHQVDSNKSMKMSRNIRMD